MKRIILIGDTIRLGYEPAVRAALSDVAVVWGPPECTQHTTQILFYLTTWVIDRNPDLVHINSGHWDSRRVIRGEDGNVVPLPIYRRNVRRILGLLQRHTRARIIWATTTPMMFPAYERTQRRDGGTSRNPQCIREYNTAATAEAARHGIAVNDLHAFVQSRGLRAMMHGDGAHFTNTGYDALGRFVAKAVRRELQSSS